jgi:large subunit ribosomal protein L22
MEFKAHHRFADMSVRKLRPFASLIRGRPVDEALELLRYLHNRGARLLEAVLKSAVGNAEDHRENRGLTFDVDDLVVSESRIDGGPMLKRIMPRARGTAYPIKRRYAHIHVTLAAPEGGA